MMRTVVSVNYQKKFKNNFFSAPYKNELEEHSYKNKKLFKIHDIDFHKILASKKESCDKMGSFKYFIGYNDNDDIRPLCIKLP